MYRVYFDGGFNEQYYLGQFEDVREAIVEGCSYYSKKYDEPASCKESWRTERGKCLNIAFERMGVYLRIRKI